MAINAHHLRHLYGGDPYNLPFVKYRGSFCRFFQRDYLCLMSRRAVVVLTTSQTERDSCYHILFLQICYEETCKKLFTLYLHFARTRRTFWPCSVYIYTHNSERARELSAGEKDNLRPPIPHTTQILVQPISTHFNRFPGLNEPLS